MAKILKLIGKVAAAILVPVFILLTFTSILLMAVDVKVFNPDFYLEVLKEEDFFEKIPEIAAVQIRYAMGYDPCLESQENCDDTRGESPSDGPPGYFQALSQKDWELLISGLLPPEWMEEEVQEVTGNLFSSLDTGKGELAIKISLEDLKDRLSGQSGIDAIAQLLEAQPECSKDDLLEMTRILEGRQEPGKDFLSCHPPDDFLKNYAPQLEVLLRRSLRDVPDSIDLGKDLFQDDDHFIKMFGVEVPPYLFVKWIRWSIRMSPLFCIGLLMIIGLLAVYSYRGISGWWGYPLAVSGFIGLALAISVGPLASWLTSTFLRGRAISGISPVMIEAASGLAVQIIRKIFAEVRNYSLIAIGMGFAIIITASVLKPNGKAKPADDDLESDPDDESAEEEEQMTDEADSEEEEEQMNDEASSEEEEDELEENSS
jgi:hypothetical protein